ncbi:MAG: aminotransferase class V-fold PLP-dependent enzyme [Verrucomicrobiaceae bacterium]|nr:aminotransferase class V-fold PLP-dependent enzyme [Verrucomicrobiaceae bacterium]
MNRYFDFNATTPLLPEAREAWLRASERHWHNPSSLYRDAGIASQMLEAARERLAELFGVEAERVVFTSGATEANNMLFAAFAGQRTAISTIEHPSVREAARHWTRMSEFNAHGAMPDDAALVSVMAANNESGELLPWRELAARCREAGIPFHTDATQWIGKLAADFSGCDYVTGSAHKFGGPKGAGFLVLRDPDECIRLLRGGPQENGRRAGTENYPAIEAMVTALETVTASMTACQASGRDAFEHAMQASFEGLRIISAEVPRLWNTSLLVMPRHENLKWLTRLSRRGFSISTGSACSSGKEGSSVVVTALGASPEELRRVVRLSGGWETTKEDWLDLAAVFAEVGAELDAGGKG